MRQALIVLGMHRTGTSALGGVLARLGAQAPLTLMPPTPENPRGYWESSALMKFHERILESAGTRWEDWDAFNPGWIASPDAEGIQDELAALLQQEYGDARLILVKDPRMCRLFPVWRASFDALGIVPKVVIPVRHPAEVARSLESRDGMTRNASGLAWLRHMLDAEGGTRDLPRAFVRYADLLQDWRTETARIGRQLDISWPRVSGAVEAELDAFLAQDLRHHVAGGAIPGSTGIGAWLQKTHGALESLVEDPGRSPALQALDEVRGEFGVASAIFAPVVHEQRLRFEQERQGLQSRLSTTSEALSELSTRHDLLKQENQANYGLYQAETQALSALQESCREREAELAQMAAQYGGIEQEGGATRGEAGSDALAELRKTCDGREAELKAMASKNEELGKRLQDMEARLAAELNAHEAALDQVESGHRIQLAQVVDGLHAEIARLEEAVRSSDESLQERFSETAALAKSVLALEDLLAARQSSLDDALLEASESETARHALEEAMLGQEARVRALEHELEAQSGLILAYREQLQKIHASKYWRASAKMRGILRPAARADTAEQGRPAEEVLRGSSLFDAEWYRRQYPDVRARRMDPVKHYLKHGAKEGRDPGPAFSTSGYVTRYPDVVATGTNPLVHYIEHGRGEGRLISPVKDNENR